FDERRKEEDMSVVENESGKQVSTPPSDASKIGRARDRFVLVVCLAMAPALVVPMASHASMKRAVGTPSLLQQDPEGAEIAREQSQEDRDRAQEDRERAQEKRDREQEARDREQEKRDREQEAREREQELYERGREALDDEHYDRAVKTFVELAKR